jgi:hypothetical protein
MIRAVIDLNIFVSALVKPSTANLVNAWREGRFQLVFSERLRLELAEVVSRPTFRRYFTQADSDVLLAQIDRAADFVNPIVTIRLCRDPKDDALLEAAVNGKAQYVVTLDPDLLDDDELTATMTREYDVSVVRPSAFFELLAVADV